MKHTKQILALLREGDFAHPGEIEAIELTLSSIAKDPKAHLLDVGCGLGGTAHYVQKEGWGKVTGLDIDKDLIHYAKSRYPNSSFICEDILNGNGLPYQHFQCVYSFSAFFCFVSQETALKNLSQFTMQGGSLVLFDYSRPDEAPILSPFTWSKTASRFSPIYLPELQKQFASTGWQFKESIDLSDHFIRWYTVLLQQFEEKQNLITEQYGQHAWDILYSGYSQLLVDLKRKKIGGIAVYATRT